MWNYLSSMLCIAFVISSTDCSSPYKRKVEQMLKFENTEIQMNFQTMSQTAFSSNAGVTSIPGTIFSPRSGQTKQKASNLLKPETIKKRMILEQTYQRALSSNPELHKTWLEIQDDLKSECQCLLRNIFPRKGIWNVMGEVCEVALMYKHIKDKYNKPFPHTKVAALVCRFPKKCAYGTYSTFIRSPDPSCVYFMNRQSSRSTAYFITEEICKQNIYPRFWEGVMEGKRRQWNYIKNGSGDRLNSLYKPDMVHQQEEYERQHRQSYLTDSVKYQMWPELERADTQIYCHMIFEKFLPGTQISISDIKSNHMPIELFYKRIKYENNAHYPSHEVCAFFCNIPPKFQINSFQFIRSPNFNCLYLVRKLHSTSKQYRITRMICDEEWIVENMVPKTELVDNINVNSTEVQV